MNRKLTTILAGLSTAAAFAVNAQLFQLLKRPFQHRQVTVAAHDDCNFLHESRNLLRRQANKRAPPVQSPERCAPATACPRKEREPIITAPLHFVMTFPPPSPISQTAHPAPFGYTSLYRIFPPLSSVFPNILCKVLFSVCNLCFFRTLMADFSRRRKIKRRKCLFATASSYDNIRLKT